MNEQQLTAFVQFCSQIVPEFKDMPLESVAEALGQLSKSNPEVLEQLYAEFTKSQQVFKKGGKLDYLVDKFKQGGKSTKKCSCGCDIVKVAEKGGIVERCACGCKSNVVKADEGTKTQGIERQVQPSGLKGLMWKPTMTKYPSEDGISRSVAEVVKPNNDTLTIIKGPWTSFERLSSPDGSIEYRRMGDDGITTYKNTGLFSKPAPKDLVQMFDKVRRSFIGPKK